VSKLWNTKHEERDVERALRHSLAQLRLDHLDLYLVHWPLAWRRTEGVTENFPRREDGSGPEFDYERPRDDGSDGLVDPSETWRGMEAVYRAGLTRSIGVSNFNEAQLAALAKGATVPCAVNQVECHPLLPQGSLLGYCRQHKIVLTAYSPLGSPDNLRARKVSDPALLSNERIVEMGAAYGKSAAQVLVRFHTQRGVVAIPKSKTPAYIQANIDTFDFSLSEAEMAELCEMGEKDPDHNSAGHGSSRPFRYGDNAGAKSHPHFPWPEYFRADI
jgi:diketogulonate reductase-like aldo/keto reductase